MRFYKDSNKVYLDSAKASPYYYELLDWRNNYEKKSLIKKSEIRVNHKTIVENVKNELADFFELKNGDVFITNSFSQGFQSLVNQVKGKPKFIVLEDDYPSISNAIKKNNFELIFVKNDSNIEKNIKIAVDKFNPDFLAISVVQWIDGILIDENFLKKLKSKYKNLTIIADGTQFCGTCNFNFEKSPYDVLISSGYKWMFAGYGVAFLLIKNHFYKNIFLKSDKLQMENAIEIGHYDMLAIGSLSFSLKKLSKSINAIEKKLKELSIIVMFELKNLNLLDDKVKIRAKHSTIFNIKDPEGALYDWLSNKNFICSKRGNGVRISFNFFNNKTEIKKLIKTIKKFNSLL